MKLQEEIDDNIKLKFEWIHLYGNLDTVRYMKPEAEWSCV